MENNSDNTEDSNWHECRMFIDGYGKFPYVIIKVGHALYMQIPIHFNRNNDVTNYPGSHINNISEDELIAYENNTLSPLHEKLIEHCQRMKRKIEADRNKTIRMCLVEGPETSYYFDEDEIEFSTSIPSGGTLLTQENKVIAMNVKHYL